MTDSNVSFLGRISLAVGTFFSILGDGEFAARVQRLRAGAPSWQRARRQRPHRAAPVAAPAPAPQPAPRATQAGQPRCGAPAARPAAARCALYRLRRRRHGELLATPTSAPPRVLVHGGCRTVLREHFTIRPVRDEAEGSRVTLPEGFDATAIRLTGNVVGKAPFTGSISHRGWRVEEVRLPRLAESHDAKVIAPAEVEL